MKNYLGVKSIKATPMDRCAFENDQKRPTTQDCENEQGYKVTYSDGYVSWSPKNVFEKAYMEIGDDNSINEHNVEDFVISYDVSKWGEKTTIVNATLANGFIITASSSCVDPANFNMGIGESICKEKIRDNVWQMLGFLLQCGMSGVRK